jgi:serine/threonine protein kinase/tetratricopeptide (TPR) repeat protein
MDAVSNTPMDRLPSQTTPTLTPGATWGSFRIVALVGRGSFGEVYQAWDPNLQREIALKILMPRALEELGPSDGGAAYEELLREARAMASVRHAHIVPIYGVDRHDGRVGFWTDFVHGKTLAAVVAEQGPFGYREAALIGLDLCKAISAVHRAGLLHRDIKAENVMREAGGRILLMDFGLSTVSHRQLDIAGSPRYMSPELFAGVPATVSSDVYSLGVLLFFLVTGEFPVRPTPSQPHGAPSPSPSHSGSDDPTLAASAIAASRPLRPRHAGVACSVLDLRADLPDDFARVIDRAIDPDPLRRYPSAGALSSAISEVLAPISREYSPVAPVAIQPESESDAKPRRKRSWRSWLITAVVLFFVFERQVENLGRRVFHLGTVKPAAPGTSASSPSLNDQYTKAAALLLRYDKHQNVTDAIAILKPVIAADPNFALAHAALGRAEFLEYRASLTPGLLDQARADCERAEQLDPNLAPPHVTLARIDAMTGNTALATSEVEQALKLDPRSAEAYGAQSEVFDAQSRGDDAIEAVEKAIDLDPDYWRWPLLLGHYDFTGGKLKEAAEQFSQAVKLSPDNSLAWRNLGLTQLQLNQYDEARLSLEKSAQLQPTFEAYSDLAELYSSQGNFAEAVAMSRKAADLSPDNYTAWGNLASSYELLPDHHADAVQANKKAIALAESSRKETPNDPTLLATLGTYYAFIGASDRSLPLLRKAVMLAPHDPTVLFLAGDGYEMLHHRDDAIRNIAQSLSLGFHRNQLDKAPELAGLRADPKFQQAVRDALGSAKTNSLDAVEKKN